MYFITCFEKCEKDKNGWFDGGAARTFGYEEMFEDAKRALNTNTYDMHEYLYTYAVIEKIGPHIHPDVQMEQWFKWDEERDGFFEIEKPDAAYGVCNHALG